MAGSSLGGRTRAGAMEFLDELVGEPGAEGGPERADPGHRGGPQLQPRGPSGQVVDDWAGAADREHDRPERAHDGQGEGPQHPPAREPGSEVQPAGLRGDQVRAHADSSQGLDRSAVAIAVGDLLAVVDIGAQAVGAGLVTKRLAHGRLGEKAGLGRLPLLDERRLAVLQGLADRGFLLLVHVVLLSVRAVLVTTSWMPSWA